MNLEIKNVLNKIEESGFEAYVVGGYVRDYILGIESFDVDICTNALPKDVIKIFNIKKETVSYGSISFKSGKYNFDITTYRKESLYENRRPQRIEYTNNLLLDIKRRDFTINSICMNSRGQIFDYLSGKEDIDNRIIRVIGDTFEKLTEDPLRILRAIRFAVSLNFNLDKEILSFIYQNKELIKNLSYARKKEELDRIFSSKNAAEGLNLLKDLDLLDTFEIDYDRIVVVPDILGIWAQINFSEKYPFTKDNLKFINDLRLVLSSGNITNYTLYTYGLYLCTVAGDILGMNLAAINEQYHCLVIHSKQELAISQKDIIDILKIQPSPKIKLIYEDVLIKVLDNALVNNYNEIKKYLVDNWK